MYFLFIKLKQILLPENLDTSKLTSIMTEYHTFKLSDLINLLPVKNKEEIIKQLYIYSDILKFSEDNELITYHIQDDIKIISIINIPSNFHLPDVEKLLNITNDNYERLYKKSLFWTLVCLGQQFDEIEKKLKETYVVYIINYRITRKLNLM